MESIENQFYKVVKIFRVSKRRELIKVNLTLNQAQNLVQSYKSSSASMVVFYKQNNYSTSKKN
jgi:hypothetical protein